MPLPIIAAIFLKFHRRYESDGLCIELPLHLVTQVRVAKTAAWRESDDVRCTLLEEATVARFTSKHM